MTIGILQFISSKQSKKEFIFGQRDLELVFITTSLVKDLLLKSVSFLLSAGPSLPEGAYVCPTDGARGMPVGTELAPVAGVAE